MNPPRIPGEYTTQLLEYRRELDALDAQVVSLLAARFLVTGRIGALKAAHNVAAADPERERAQLERLLSISGEFDLPSEVTRAVYETLFGIVRAHHQAASANAGTAETEAEE